VTTEQSAVLFEKRDGIARITLNRPAARNALTRAMFKDLAAAVIALRDDNATRLVVLRANGTDFTVGADLKDMSGVVLPSPAERGEQLVALAREISWPIFLGLHELRQPIIASVRGHVIGAGAQLVLSADLTIASDTARILLPQVRLGHPVDHGESYYLPRKIGIGRAMQLLLLAETLSAAQAEQYGLVNWAVPDADLDQKTEELVQRIANGATVAICETKALLRQSADNSFADQFAAEGRSLGVCAATDDFPEAINAFLEKRKPAFKGR
jgi:2-(1,2-epoxy-1,2-dihydrophenyl)acetyl-CoA isomerase